MPIIIPLLFTYKIFSQTGTVFYFRLIKGFHDEALKGQWQGYRSSRLDVQYRIIYHAVKEKLYVQVIDITTHDYRRR